MPRLPESFIQQVQQANDIVEVIGQYVSLKRKGKDYLGLCPFHQEKTPSFTVSPTKQFFKCFGCGVGGGVYQFLMRQMRVEFPEAVRLLADRAGMKAPTADEPAGQAGLGRAELVKANTFAARFFRDQLHTEAGRAALEYARSRQISDESIRRFGLGWAPDGWDGLALAARAAGLREELLVAAGLVAAREAPRRGCYDRFRNRLMFPILDVTGRVIAFGGRALAADERAKYLNTPETALFDKSSHLYGLNWARDAIDRTGQAIVVEGYLDMVIPAQAGVENVVATLGTALTERHVRMLARFAQDVVLVFDADRAGAAAAERALDLCIAQDVQARVAAIPDGKDPCDFVLAHGGEAFGQIVQDAPDALEYAWRQSAAGLAGDNLVQQRRAAEEFLRRVVHSAAYGTIDAVREGLLINRLGQLLGLSADQLRRQVRALTRQVPTASNQRPAVNRGVEAAPAPQGLARAQRQILEVLLVEPDQFEHVARHIGMDDFDDPTLAALARHIWRLGDEGTLSVASLLAVSDGEDWARLVTDLAGSAEQRGQPQRFLNEALEMLEAHHRRLEERQLAEQARGDDDGALRAIQQRLRQPGGHRRPAVP